MPRQKKEAEITDANPRIIQEPHPRLVAIEKYTKEGFKVADIDGVLMFVGKYDIRKISKMLNDDGYRGSYGVRC